VTVPLDQSHLHEETTEDGLLDASVIFLIGGGSAVQTAFLLAHNTHELLTDAISLLESTEVEVIAPAPVTVHSVLFKTGESI
jgi:hypothetical protein